MLGPVAPSDYDWNFRIGRIPVTVSIWFWVGSSLLGMSALEEGIEFLVVWIAAVLVSILFHELGHAWTAQYFGFRPRILLYQFGGLAMYENWRPESRWQSVLITAAGPLAGFLLFGVLTVYYFFLGDPLSRWIPENSLRVYKALIFDLLYINFFWSVMNLLPVLPLDGGRLSQQFFGWLNPRRGDRYTCTLGALVAGVVAILAIVAWKDFYLAILFGMLASQNFSALQNRSL
ncbi:metalloprotease [Planctomicrobium sp. SH664]|uniref:metalloprotease n=1 Tax=Planctomicrobium sp. SH664 TaxID=3448125 RepID=UPI003F5CA10F